MKYKLMKEMIIHTCKKYLINNIMTRKIPIEYENPIDNYLISLCDNHIEKCIIYNISPNYITIFRLGLSILIIIVIYNSNYFLIPTAGFYFCYLLDCMDGHLARTTNNVTILGDVLDHFTDIFSFSSVLLILSIKNYEYKVYVISSLIILLFFTSMHLGLQQKYYQSKNKEENKEITIESLDIFTHIYDMDIKNIRWTRYFGLGTLTLFTGFAIMYMQTHSI